ncbi:MAG TPA: class I SAM-dependent methyltransferase [Dehalococcoidia bacterium]|nr:class I SAM-dependent methyltransferase [Dehalococcoidia bacterium]
MTLEASGPIYAMGRTREETDRLIAQSRLYDTNTRRLLEEAGAGPGMKILDVGTGAGDIAIMAAEMVGPSGAVVGLDQNPAILDTARARASAAGLDNATFIHGDLQNIALSTDFDIAVGRLVLMYLPDPVAALKHIASLVKPGGALGFQEINLPELRAHYETSDPWLREMIEWLIETFEISGADAAQGERLYENFLAAGLEPASMWSYTPIGGGPGWAGYEYIAATYRSLLPLTEKFGIATAEQVGVDTLAQRLRAHVMDKGLPGYLAAHVSAWARKPL